MSAVSKKMKKIDDKKNSLNVSIPVFLGLLVLVLMLVFIMVAVSFLTGLTLFLMLIMFISVYLLSDKGLKELKTNNIKKR